MCNYLQVVNTGVTTPIAVFLDLCFLQYNSRPTAVFLILLAQQHSRRFRQQYYETYGLYNTAVGFDRYLITRNALDIGFLEYLIIQPSNRQLYSL